MNKIKWLYLIFGITIVISIFIFVKWEGYNGMFDSFKNKKDTTIIYNKNNGLVKYDTVHVYHVIVGSFKNVDNALNLSKTIPFSDVIRIKNGFYLVSIKYFFEKSEAVTLKESIGKDTWIYENVIIIEI